MKRIILEPLQTQLVQNRCSNENYETMQSMQSVCDFVSQLKLLNEVPFSYLIPNEKLLPPESIRFFYIDENWMNALSDGAISIGRITELEAVQDNNDFELICDKSIAGLSAPRYQRMHPNHRRSAEIVPVSGEQRTGFVLRSELVKKWKGMELFGYCKEQPLEILRMDTLAEDILLGIFDGELTRIVLSESKTGLRFGAPDNQGVITLRDTHDTDDFGKPLSGKTIDLKQYQESNGKIKAASLAKQMESQLGVTIGSSEFAFELIAVAKRAEFRKGEEH